MDYSICLECRAVFPSKLERYDREPVCPVCGGRGLASFDEADPAAAPELLAACRELLPVVDELLRDGDERERAMIERARAAIAAATA